MNFSLILAAALSITPGPEWIPMSVQKEPEPGSILDFSNQGFTDAPSGKHGWIVVRKGQFEYERKPGLPLRFYGGNLSTTACYPETDDEAEQLIARLARLGYNTARIHHHDGICVKDSADGITLNEERMACLDRLIAAAVRHGFYLTTDLFVTRPVQWRQIGVDREGKVPRSTYKFAILTDPGARADFECFTRNFLEHRNTQTGRRYLEEPALAFISLINEGELSMRWDKIREDPYVKKAWAQWLAEKRALQPKFAAAFSPDAPPRKCYSGEAGALLQLFNAEVEAKAVTEITAFLRKLGCKALLTNNNCSRHDAPFMRTAGLYDYVDDHYYFNHPKFIGKGWASPCHVDNEDFVQHPGAGVTKQAFKRLADKPFTISEINYCGASRARAFGPFLAGAMAARQGWGAIWRFNYAMRASDWQTDNGGPDPFCVARDPLMQAGDRAAVLFYLRRDMPEIPARRGIALEITPKAVNRPKGKDPLAAFPNWNLLAWNLRVATCLKAADASGYRVVNRVLADKAEFVDELKQNLQPFGGYRCDSEHGVIALETERSVALYVRTGTAAAGPLAATVSGEAASLLASGMDGRPLKDSRRILFIHLTDLQGSKAVFTDETRSLIKKFGGQPLLRAGRAEVSLSLEGGGTCTVWALDMSGHRVAQVPSVRTGKVLSFTADVAGPEGGRMYYEIVR